MPRYHYTAQIGVGERVSAVAEAPNLPALAASLAAEGARIDSGREVPEKAPRIRGIPYFEIIGLYRQMASSMEAGLPLAETIEMLSNESRNVRLKSLLYFLKAKVSQGTPLSEALGAFPDIFPRVHVAAVRSGEEGDNLEKALGDLADQAEALSNMNRRFASALVYPTVIAFFALGLFSFSLMVVVPRFATLFSDLGIRDLPPITRFVIFLTSTVLPTAVPIGLGLVVFMALILTQREAASGRLWLDRWKLRIPILGQIVEKAALARFSGTLGLLLDSGVELPRAIRLASEGAGNRVIEHLLKNVCADVELGNTLSESIDRTGAMPPALAWRIGVGEESGALSDALLRMSRLQASQVESLVTSAAGILEPALIIFIGSGVAMLVVGLILPLVAIIQNLSGGG
ncbi:MAG: type II secretion system F family protein [Armatimonadetes bacterium]|nr:type II secretion system F family protein [Armatimonadota bacterium]